MRPLQARGMLAFFLILGIVSLDQLTKFLTRLFIEVGDSVSLIPGIIQLTHSQNSGASFGILKDARWVFMTASTIAIIAIIVFMVLESRKQGLKRPILLTVALAFVTGGGIGNMIDRLFVVNQVGKNVVTDMFEFLFMDFAIFNVADIFISIGGVLIGVYIIFFEPKYEKAVLAVKNDKENTVCDEKHDN